MTIYDNEGDDTYNEIMVKMMMTKHLMMKMKLHLN